jgi:hypothetical protein
LITASVLAVPYMDGSDTRNVGMPQVEGIMTTPQPHNPPDEIPRFPRRDLPDVDGPTGDIAEPDERETDGDREHRSSRESPPPPVR